MDTGLSNYLSAAAFLFSLYLVFHCSFCVSLSLTLDCQHTFETNQ